MNPRWLTILNRDVIACTRCPRLVAYREQIAREKRRAYLAWDYWGKPVPSFGDPNARVLIMGLAPGAHGSNRTGRPFTGDASGNFMYPILYETGFANQPTATDRSDGLVLKDIYITAAARCAPPENKPLPQELANCAPYLDRELDGLNNVRVIVALGRIGFEAYLNYLKRKNQITGKKDYLFAHGAEYVLPAHREAESLKAESREPRAQSRERITFDRSAADSVAVRRAPSPAADVSVTRTLLASYHPSNQNTQTGKLTKEMFRKIFIRSRELADL